MTVADPERVLVLAPTEGDAAITQAVFHDAGIACLLCASTDEVAAAMHEAAGAILMTEDVLLEHGIDELIAELRHQPAWSDIPVLLLAGSRGLPLPGLVAELGNLTVLDRPVRVGTLISATRTAIRARRRQYEIRDQMVALEQAKGQLREADRRKDEFLAILAHELRNPLTPARNAAYLMKLQGPNDPDLQHAVGVIERQISQMSRLIDDLLDVSRITRGLLELRRERLELREIVDAAVEASRQLMQARQHELHVRLPREPLVLSADRERLIQVMSNLITNAAKYTPAGGHIEVSARKVDGTFEVSVQDDGIGLPPEKLAEIFELFAQVDRSSERNGGLGIGLTLVRQIVELHGGSVEAHSAGVGKGSQFIVRLPIAEVAPSRPRKAGDAVATARVTRRVLAADDNRDAAESLAALLRLQGHEVRLAFDGEAAIEATRDFVPEVALLDLGMPKQSGLEVARHIRRQAWGNSVYIIALTGWGQESDRARAREAGFDAHLVKPVEPGALTRVLANLSTAGV